MNNSPNIEGNSENIAGNLALNPDYPKNKTEDIVPLPHKMPSNFLPPDQKTATPEEEWLEKIQTSVITSEKLRTMDIPPRPKIVGGWFSEGDLGFIFAPRGMGKTWFSLYLARCISEGVDFYKWKIPEPKAVLYVDGEMPLDAIKERHRLLSNANNKLDFLHHEQVFQATGAVLNLCNMAAQQALLKYCLNNQIKVLFLDNLSCLFSGLKENDADSWEMVLPWLLQFRRHRIAVVIIHHAGRNGQMRGTSRREDAAYWIIQLSQAQMNEADGHGAHFNASFVKNRNATNEDMTPFSCFFKQSSSGVILPIFRALDPLSLLRYCIEEMGLTSASDIAEEIGISKGQVSKLAKKAADAGWLGKVGRDYAIKT